MPRLPRFAAVFSVLLGLSFPPVTLRASSAVQEAAHARLELDTTAAGDGCISQAELEQAVQAQLGRVVFVEPGGAATLLVRVRIEAVAPRRFRAAVSSEALPATDVAPASQRELEAASDCRSLDEQLALVVALLVEADPEPEPAPPEAAPEPEPPPEPPAPPVQDTSAVSSAPNWESKPAGPWHLSLGASGVVGVGALPDISVGAALALLATPPAWPGLRFRAVGFAPGKASAASGAWIELVWVFSGLAVCPELGSFGRFTLTGCLGVDGTYTHAESHGLDDGKSASRFGGQASGSLLAAFVLGGGFSAELEAGTAIPFDTTRFTADVAGERVELHRTPFAPGLFSLGVFYEFY